MVLLNLGGLIYSVCTKSTSSDPNLLSKLCQGMTCWVNRAYICPLYGIISRKTAVLIKLLVPSGIFFSTCRHNILKKISDAEGDAVLSINLVRAVDLAPIRSFGYGSFGLFVDVDSPDA